MSWSVPIWNMAGFTTYVHKSIPGICIDFIFFSWAWDRLGAWYGLSALSYDCPKKVFPDTDWPHWDTTMLKSFSDMMCQTCKKKVILFMITKR